MSKSALIPAQIMRMVDNGRKKSNLEVIVDYLVSEPGTVELTEKQEELLERWRKADALLRDGKYSSKDVANVLTKTYEYGIASAWRDIEDTRYIFGSTRKTNKQYIVNCHLEEIDEAIKTAKSTGNQKLLPILFDCRTRALAQLKDDDQRKAMPVAMIFNITQNNNTSLITIEMTENDAEDVVRKRMEEKGITLDLQESDYNLEPNE